MQVIHKTSQVWKLWTSYLMPGSALVWGDSNLRTLQLYQQLYHWATPLSLSQIAIFQKKKKKKKLLLKRIIKQIYEVYLPFKSQIIYIYKWIGPGTLK